MPESIKNGDLVRAIDPEFIPVAYAMNRMRLAGLDVRLARDKVSVRAQGLAASLFVHPGNLVDGRKVDRMIRFARRADDMIAADLS